MARTEIPRKTLPGEFTPRTTEKVRYLLSGVLSALYSEGDERPRLEIKSEVDVIQKLRLIGPPVVMALEWLAAEREADHG